MSRPKNFTFRPRGNESIELFRSGRIEGTIDLIYWHPFALRRHRSAPLLKEREQFLLHLLRQGSRPAVRLAASMLLKAVDALQLRRLRELDLLDISDATQKIWGHRLTKASSFYGHGSAYTFRGVIKKFLRFHGKFKTVRSLPCPFETQLEGFDKFNRSRNLTPSSVESYRLKVATFFKWLSSRTKNISRLSVADIDRFISLKKAKGWAPATISSTTQAIRVFVRYAHAEGWCSDIADGIKAPAHSRFAIPSQARSWDEIERLLAATDGDESASVRAKAALSLISVYALRCSEVARLMLADFDWKKGTVTLRRSKRGRLQRLPIQADVGRAVLKYIKVRPRCTCRQLFVTLRPRYRPIGKRSFYDLTSFRLKKLGITSGRLGPHSIRHARVMQLLRGGTSVKEIGDFLGQRHPESPLFYAKYDVELLREVADFKLEGLL